MTASQVYLLHALSPLHAGAGGGDGLIDRPIARMGATGMPIVPGSAIRGVLRHARAMPISSADDEHRDKWLATFGGSDHAGALRVSDARLLAFPVRSFKGTFAYITSPLLLHLAKRDLGLQHQSKPVPELPQHTACVRQQSVLDHDGKLYLQDLDLSLETKDADVQPWTDWLAALVCGTDDILSRRFAIVDDETMSFLWDTATQVKQRVRINEERFTADTGALWLEESLPPESILIGQMEAVQSSKGGVVMEAGEILDFAFGQYARGREIVLRFGGKATVGCGLCRLLPVP
jgi:CRISPR-associated protein Cmr4